MATNTIREGKQGNRDAGDDGSPGATRVLRWPLVGASAFWEMALVPSSRALAFWIAVGLPWVLLGLLFVGFPGQYPGSFAALVSTNLLCAVVGHPYNDADRARPER